MRTDLENFPTSTTALQMMLRISPIYEYSYVGKWIFQIMGMEMDEARAYFEELRLQAFPETATWGLVYWEERYGIPTDETLGIEKRRHGVLIRRGKKSPMNPARIEKIIGDMCGREVRVTENIAPYTFSVSILEGETTVDYGDILAQLRKIKPAHLSFNVLFESSVGVKVRPDKQHYYFPYILAGTVPETNTVGGIHDYNINPFMSAESNTFYYPLCGENDCGG